jgi:hypothetical protein
MAKEKTIEKDQKASTFEGAEKNELSEKDFERVSGGLLDSMHQKTAGDQD